MREHFDLRPAAILRDLDLRRPIYRATAAYGHFGRDQEGFTWERTDRAEALARALGAERGAAPEREHAGTIALHPRAGRRPTPCAMILRCLRRSPSASCRS